jgi:hypothetical protein
VLRLQKRELLLRCDALSNHVQLEALSHVNDGSYDWRVIGAASEPRIPPKSKGPDAASPSLAEFGRLHGISVMLESGVLLAGFAAMYLPVRKSMFRWASSFLWQSFFYVPRLPRKTPEKLSSSL